MVAQTVKHLPTMQETQFQSLGWEDALKKGMATHSSILASRIPWTKSLAGYSPLGCRESDMTEQLTLSLSGEELKRIEETDFPPIDESERGE